MEENIKLKSGKEIYANSGFISINEDLEIAEGYDGGVPLSPIHKGYEFAKEHMEVLTKKKLWN